jgi:acyl-CoA thioester hydrolase
MNSVPSVLSARDGEKRQEVAAECTARVFSDSFSLFRKNNKRRTMEGYAFSMEMAVRDYECDIQGVVNNGVYMNYLEHVRHEYLKHIGIDFADYARQGINLMVVRAELDYKFPLESGDRFVVHLNLVRDSRVKFAFQQDINARIIGTAVNANGRPEIPEQLDKFVAA